MYFRVLVYALHSLEYVLGLARFRVFVTNTIYTNFTVIWMMYMSKIQEYRLDIGGTCQTLNTHTHCKVLDFLWRASVLPKYKIYVESDVTNCQNTGFLISYIRGHTYMAHFSASGTRSIAKFVVLNVQHFVEKKYAKNNSFSYLLIKMLYVKVIFANSFCKFLFILFSIFFSDSETPTTYEINVNWTRSDFLPTSVINWKKLEKNLYFLKLLLKRVSIGFTWSNKKNLENWKSFGY